jgi:hypothetical protein
MSEATASRVFCNSLPKSGTFLLSRALQLLGFPRRRVTVGSKLLAKLHLGTPPILGHEASHYWEGRLWRWRFPLDEESITVGAISPVLLQERLLRRWLSRLPQRLQFLGHVPYSPAMAELLRELGYRHVVIVRDPRDVLVSLLHYLLHPAHELSGDLLSLAPEQRLSLLVDGGVAPLSGRKIRGVGGAMRSMLEWSRSPDALVVRFEDLVGPQGGGSEELQRRAMLSICCHLGATPDASALQRLCAGLYSQESPTFRKGRIGGWQDELAEECRDLVERSEYTELAGYGQATAAAPSQEGQVLRSHVS